jgi:glycosyltransferase involved in cell wall biosynthesis
MHDLEKSDLQVTKPNVLLLFDSFETGGAETQMLLLARLLVQSGHYGVHLACLTRRGPLLDQAAQLGIADIPEFPLTSFYNWNALVQMRRFIRFLRQRQISVIHTEGFYTNVFGLVGAALARVPARVGFRGSVGGWLTPRQELLERIAFRFASVAQANAEAVKTFLVSQGVPAHRVVVVHYGLDLSAVAVPQNLSRADALRLLNLPTDAERRFVSIVANLHNPIKNYPMFLRAAARVREEVPTAAFVIAGEGALMDDLRQLAGELGLENHVFFIGRCDRVAELLFASDVCVLSSKGEGFSRSILEYMGAGRPVVATDVGGAHEVIVEGETGYLVQSGDHETMAARIANLLTDEAKARGMGERGRQVVHERFSAEAQLIQTERLYDELLAASRRGRVDVGAAMKTVDRIA